MYQKKPNLLLIRYPEAKTGNKRLSDIQQFIQARDWNFSSDELEKEVLEQIPVKNAIDEWAETIENVKTSWKYKRSLNTLFTDSNIPGGIKLETPIIALGEEWSHGMYGHIQEFVKAAQTTKSLYMTVYAGFCDFIRTKTYGIVDPEVGIRERDSFRRAEDIYNGIDWLAFIDTIEEPYKLMAKLIFTLAKSWRYRLRVSQHEKNMLSMTMGQLNFANNTIRFEEEQAYNAQSCILPVSSEIMKQMKKPSFDKDELVFTSAAMGKKLYPNQVERALAKASKQFGLEFQVTPIILGWLGVISQEHEIQQT